MADHRQGTYLIGRGPCVEAEKLYENIIADRKHLFGLDDVGTFDVTCNLALVYQPGGHYIDAERLFEQELQSRDSRLRPQHGDTLEMMNNITLVCFLQKGFDEAEVLFKQTLERDYQYSAEDDNELHMASLLADICISQEVTNRIKSYLTRVAPKKQTRFRAFWQTCPNVHHDWTRFFKSAFLTISV